MKSAQQIFDEVFTNSARDPRSSAYKRGAFEHWNLKLHGVKFAVPFEAGTAEFDAYFAGADEAANFLALEKIRALEHAENAENQKIAVV